jgi:hypothetical protein
MPIVHLNPLITAIHGRVGNVVFKTYRGNRIVMTRMPRFDGYVPTPAQRARRKRMAEATAYAQQVYADPEQKALYIAGAKKLRRQPFRLAISDHLAREKLLEKSRTAAALTTAESAAIERLARCGAFESPVRPPVATAPAGRQRPPVRVAQPTGDTRRDDDPVARTWPDGEGRPAAKRCAGKINHERAYPPAPNRVTPRSIAGRIPADRSTAARRHRLGKLAGGRVVDREHAAAPSDPLIELPTSSYEVSAMTVELAA